LGAKRGQKSIKKDLLDAKKAYVPENKWEVWESRVNSSIFCSGASVYIYLHLAPLRNRLIINLKKNEKSFFANIFFIHEFLFHPRISRNVSSA
jgi:hypothetical protein